MQLKPNGDLRKSAESIIDKAEKKLEYRCLFKYNEFIQEIGTVYRVSLTQLAIDITVNYLFYL